MFFRATFLALLLGSAATAQVAPAEMEGLRAEMDQVLGAMPEASTQSPARARVAEFAVSRWHPELLERLFAGPSFLDPRTDFAVPPPPANGSAETQQELLNLLLLQRDARGSRDALYVQIEDRRGILPADVLYFHGMIPPLDEAPELWSLLDTVNDEALWFVLREKMRFSRARPSDLDPVLRPLVTVPAHAAYPSGHAAQYQAVVGVLGALVPDCHEAWRALASEIAHRREVAGLHFASDTEAGRALGERIANALLEGGHLEPMIERLTAAVEERDIARPTCGGV